MSFYQFIQKLSGAVGLDPMDFLTIIMVAWAAFDLWKFVPKWKTLDSTLKSNVRLVFILWTLPRFVDKEKSQ